MTSHEELGDSKTRRGVMGICEVGDGKVEMWEKAAS